MLDISISFNSLNRPKYLERGMASVAWRKFKSKLVIDDGSSPENIEKIKGHCKKYGFDLVEKKKRSGISNSWNLGLLFSEARYNIFSNDDIVYHPSDLWIEYLEKAFSEDFLMVSLRYMNSFVVDKRVISLIGWFDERYPFAGFEDGDFILRLKKLNSENGRYKTIYRGDGRPSLYDKEVVFHHPHDLSEDEPRTWVDESELVKNHRFFLEKWHVDEDKIREKVGGIVISERRLSQYAYELGLADRKMDEEDFYPDMKIRYANDDFSCFEGTLDSIERYYKFGA